MDPKPAAVLAVYRRRNARHLRALLRDLPASWPIALWGLDGVSRRLADHTVGSGPGTKFDLLNRLYAACTPAPGADVVVADDDVTFVKGGSLLTLIDLARKGQFSLAMPAHTANSPHSFSITRAVPGNLARLTTFVEIGPLFVVAAAARSSVLPFPDDVGMGWGLELEWNALVRDGHRLGIIDAFPIKHRGRVAAEYDQAPERQRLADAFEARGVSGWESVQQVLGVWRPGQLLPPWLDLPG